MKAKRIILFLIALTLLAAVIVTATLVLTQLKDEIDISETAKKVFDEFKSKALNGEITELNNKEKNVADRFSEVEDICLDSAGDILREYSRATVEYGQALDALNQYYLFPVDEKDINTLIEKIVAIEEGRNAYSAAMSEADPLTAVLLCSRVDREDSAYYSRSKDIVSRLLDTNALKAYVYENLSKNRVESTVKTLQSLDLMWDKDNEVKSLLSFSESYKANQENTVTYKGPIEILSTRNLMAFPDVVYAPNSQYANSYDSSLITAKEFKSILAQLYNNNYILISLASITSDNLYGIQLPEGKKPLVFIAEDLTYPNANKGSGICSSLAVDEEGKLCTLTNSIKSYDNESVLILESFIRENPDFTYKGARGCISLTGYSGIFGYDIGNDDGRAKAKEIADILKADGWTFACHSYSYADMHKASLDTLKWDTEKWAEQIEPVVGKSEIYVWPYGSHVRSGEKFNYLREHGYRTFLGQGITPYKSVEGDGTAVFFDRRSLTGYALRNYTQEYSHLFDSNEVLDDIRPKKEEQES